MQMHYGRQAVVLGPNGMPHYQPQFAASQEPQPQLFDGEILQQQESYDFEKQDS
jgi:hypothetical protein